MDVGEAVRRPNELGWSVGDVLLVGPAGREWLVTGSKGVLSIRAEGRSEAEAHADPGRNGTQV
jgi:hypothetical protein